MRSSRRADLLRGAELGPELADPAAAGRCAAAGVCRRRDSSSTFSTMRLTRSALSRMIRVRRRSSSGMCGDSASSWPAWLIAPMGVRISCAMLALTAGPARRAWTAALSRRSGWCPRGRSAPGPGAPSPGARNAAGSAARRRPRRRCRFHPRRRAGASADSRNSRRGEHSPSSASGQALALPRIPAAGSLIRRMRSSLVHHQDALAQLGARCTATAARGWPGPPPGGAPAPRSATAGSPSGAAPTAPRGRSPTPSTPALQVAAAGVRCQIRAPPAAPAPATVAVAAMNRASRLRASMAMAPMGSSTRMPRPPCTPPLAHSIEARWRWHRSAHASSASMRRPADGRRRSGDQPDAREEIRPRRSPSSGWAARCRADPLHRLQRARNEQAACHQQAIQVDQPDYAPGEVRRRKVRWGRPAAGLKRIPRTVAPQR